MVFRKNVKGIFSVSLFLLLCAGAVCPAAAGESLVPAAERIPDEQARLELARILSHDEKTVGEAVRQYEILRGAAPGNTDVRLELAHLYGRLKRYSEALAEYDAVLARRPGDPQALREKGRIHFARGEFPLAAESLERLRRDGKADAEALRDLGLANAWSGKPDGAIDAFREILSAGKKDAGLLIAWGDAALAAGRLPEAAERYRDALSLEPPSDEARRKLGLALSWLGRDGEAQPLLAAARTKSPDDREVLVELARIAARKKDYPAALAFFERLTVLHPGNAALLSETADVEAAAGHAEQCRGLYRRALLLAADRESMQLRYASRRNLWGDFHGAEKTYRGRLAAGPDDAEIEKALAGVLAAAQRYEEAEGIWMRRLALDPSSEDALLGMSRLRIAQKDGAGALGWADKGLSLFPRSPEGKALRADALYAAGRDGEALGAYNSLLSVPAFRLHALKRLGRIHERAGDREAARRVYAQARSLDAGDPEIRYRIGRLEGEGSEALLRSALAGEKKRPDRLCEWASVFAETGDNRSAIACYEGALAADAAYFPAKSGLAELLGGAREYERSISLYDELAAAFPESVKIQIGKARVLSWARRYRESMALYERISAANPDDPVPKMERARVAMWGKYPDEAMRTYASLETPPVGPLLFADLSPLTAAIADRELQGAIARLNRVSQDGRAFAAYEAVAESAERSPARRDSELRRKIDLALADRHALWRIQKGAALEKQAKSLSWEQRHTQALAAYEELLSFAPGNEEARFDYAQANCALGLCDREREIYRDLLAVDPLHGLAAAALRRQEIRSGPSLRMGQSYWHEDGRGDLARTTRHRTDLTLDLPFSCRHRLKLSGHHWIESPRDGGSHAADGGSIEVASVLTPNLTGGAGWTRKSYGDAGPGNTDTGYGRLSFNVRDHLLLSGGWEKGEEAPNGFALRQGIRKDTWWISGSSRLTRRLDIEAKLSALEYSDDNGGTQARLSAGYEFTDHPRVFKVILSGEYRDTREGNGYSYSGGQLADIRHPYWTPQNYTAGGITLEWRHDLSQLFFCGAELHYYDIRLSFGTDSESNPSARLEADWNYDFAERWTLGAGGMIHRSGEWNAEALTAFLRYRF